MRTPSDADVAEALRRTLHDHAGRVAPPAGDFDPARPRNHANLAGAPARHRGRRMWLVAATIVVVAGLALVVAVARRGGPSHDEVATSPGGEASPVPGAPAPSTAPSGLKLWSVTWGDQGSSYPDRTQLFGAADGSGGQVLVTISRPNPGSTGCCNPVTVRGQRATIAPAKEFAATTTAINWQEGATITAKFNGMAPADAIAFLNQLQWRSADHQAGFADPAGTPLVELGDAAPNSGAVAASELVYRDIPSAAGPHEGKQLTIRSRAATGHITAEYLKAWFDGTRASDGTTHSYDPTFATYIAVSPNGRYVWADANATPTSEEALRAVADSVVPHTGAQMLELRARAEHNAASLPLIGTARFGPGTVQVRGDATTRTLCFQAPQATLRCATPASQISQVVGSFVIDGHWYVTAASNGAPITITNGTGPNGQPLPTEQSHVGQALVVLVEPPAASTGVGVTINSQGAGYPRPPF